MKNIEKEILVEKILKFLEFEEVPYVYSNTYVSLKKVGSKNDYIWWSDSCPPNTLKTICWNVNANATEKLKWLVKKMKFFEDAKDPSVNGWVKNPVAGRSYEELAIMLDLYDECRYVSST